MATPSAPAVLDDGSVYDLVPEGLAPAPARPRVLLVGTALAGGAVVMVFSTLLGLYLRTRAGVVNGPPVDGQAPRWLADASHDLPLTPGTIALFTILISCVSMQWAVDAVRNDDRRNAYFALALTILFGASVINATAFLYGETGLPVATTAGVVFYALTGAHLALIAGALVFAALMTFRTFGGEYAGRDREGIVAASLIWYLTAAIYAVIWYAVYVTK